MELAHTLGQGGPEIEYLVIAVILLVLGVIFFMQKAVKPVVSVVAKEEIPVEVELFGDASATQDGHLDVRVDGEIETMTPDASPEITFEPGEHTLQVEYVNARLESFDPPVKTEIRVTPE